MTRLRSVVVLNCSAFLGLFEILCHRFNSWSSHDASESKSQVREWAFNLPRRRSCLLLERCFWNCFFHLQINSYQILSSLSSRPSKKIANWDIVSDQF